MAAGRYVLAVGRLNVRKNLERLIVALAGIPMITTTAATGRPKPSPVTNRAAPATRMPKPEKTTTPIAMMPSARATSTSAAF